MKKAYEKLYSLIIITVIFMISELCFVLLLFNIKINTFKVYSSIAIKKDLFEIVIEKDNDIFDKNTTLYIDNHKYSFKKALVTHDIINNYDSVIIKVKHKEKVREKDVINISVFDKRIPIISIFKIIIKGD